MILITLIAKIVEIHGNRNAKIVVTLGPTSSELQIIENLFLAGVDAFGFWVGLSSSPGESLLVNPAPPTCCGLCGLKMKRRSNPSTMTSYYSQNREKVIGMRADSLSTKGHII